MNKTTSDVIDNYRSNQSKESASLVRLASSPWMYRLFLMRHLPMAFIARLKVKEISLTSCTISVPYNWINKNPFRSTYFAVLSMAAEMSTGLLAMAYVRNAKPSISMLVTNIEGSFTKKAVGPTMFKCNSGDAMRLAIEEAIITSQPQTFRSQTIGTNGQGDEIALFYITWSFKVKNSKLGS